MFLIGNASFKKLNIVHNDINKNVTIVFPSFWNNSAYFSFRDKKYSLNPDSILLKSITIDCLQSPVGEIEFDWMMSSTIKLKNIEGMTKMFICKSTSIFKHNYTLHDLLTNHLLTISQKWNWSRFNFDYHIQYEDGLQEEENKVDLDLLTIISLFTVYLISKKRRRKRNG